MSEMEKESDVTLPKLIKRTCDRLPLYSDKAIKEIVTVFLDELRDAIIKNYCVKLRGFFAFRHKWMNEKRVGNFGEPTVYPAHMAIKVTVSRDGLLKPLNKYYKETGKKKPGTLYDVPLGKFK